MELSGDVLACAAKGSVSSAVKEVRGNSTRWESCSSEY